jgi:alginate O-acetyltransferase complex protein AlgI
MLFDSLVFPLFFAIVFALIALFELRKPWWILLLSLVFYGCQGNVLVVGVLILSIAGNYLLGLGIQRSNLKRVLISTAWFWNIGFIGVFKYLLPDLLSGNDYIVPLGLSYFTLQCLSYCSDVYYKTIKAENNILVFGAYVTFFSQLIIGPIERARDLIPQLRSWSSFEYDRTVKGARFILVGFFMKIVLSNRIALLTHPIFENFNQYDLQSCLSSMPLFALQLYFDFAGYSLIAIGCAKMLGIELSDNFRMPFMSSSVSEFWRRWHISVSFWFRDYVYKPVFRSLKGNSISFRHIASITITFVLLSVWHSFLSWNFLVVGLIQAVFLSLEYLISYRPAAFIGKWIGRVYTFGVFSFSCLFFNLQSFDQFQAFCSRLVAFDNQGLAISNSTNPLDLYTTAALVSLFLIFEAVQFEKDIIGKFQSLNPIIRWTLYSVFGLSLMFFGVYSDASSFIYKQF